MTQLSAVVAQVPGSAAYALLLVGTFVLSLALIPLVIRVAQHSGVLDFPSEERHVHTAPIPRLGGVAILVATIIGLFAWWLFAPATVNLAESFIRLLPGIAMGAAVVFATGVVDDVVGVSPRVKVIAQTVAAAAVLAHGLGFEALGLTPGGLVLPVPALAGAALLALWSVGTTNAFNLIDGIDGLAGTFALIGIAAGITADVILHGGASVPLYVALGGAVIAFLRFNGSPASIFLGDSGSMTLGFLLAVLVVNSSTDANGVLYPIVPLAALAFPLTDTFIAIARRWLRGDPLSRADSRHVHHQLLGLGISVRQTVEVLGVVFATVALMGVAIAFAPARLTAALAVAGGVLIFVLAVYGVRALQYREFSALVASVSSVVRHGRRVVQDKLRADELADAIGSATTLDEVKALLESVAGSPRIIDVELVELAEGLHAHGPPGQRLSPYDALPVRLDYAFAVTEAGGEVREFALRVWTERPRSDSHQSAERLAARLGPALERWFAERSAGEVAPVVTRPVSTRVSRPRF